MINTKKIILLSLLFIGVTIISAGVYTSYIIVKSVETAEQSYQELDRGNKSALRPDVVSIENDPISILILGLEDYSSQGNSSRADTLMVATLNPEEQRITLLSIPRDTRVEIVGKNKYDKINHSYVYGQTDMTVATVEKLLNIPIDYYVKVNFTGFKNIIDLIGGIKVNVPFDFSEKHDKRNGTRIYYTKGEMHLNGEQALGYARMRKQDPRGDFGRNDRQKEIVNKVVNKLATPSSFFKIEAIASEIGNNIETNFKLENFFSFYKHYKGIDSKNLTSLKLNGYDKIIDGIYYFVPYEDEISNIQQNLRQQLNIVEEGTNQTTSE